MTILKKTFLPEILDRIDAKIALRNGIGASIAWVVAGTFSELLPHPNPMISSLWCVLTTLLVLQAHLGGTYRAAWTRFLGLTIGTVTGAILASFLGADAWTLGLSTIVTVLICSLFNLQEAYRIAVSTVAVIMILLPMNPNNTPLEFSFYRFMDSCLGIIIGVVIAHTIFPYTARTKLRLSLAEAMRDLGRLYRLTVTAVEPNDNQKKATLLLIKEIDTLLYQNRETLDDSKAELITKSAHVEDWIMLMSQMDDLFEQVLSMRHVYRPDTKKVFDADLNHQLHDVVDKISISFEDISNMLSTGIWVSSLPDLGLSLTQLKDELLRFRGSRRSREFNLEEVESFFVFFYSLKSILELLKRIEATIYTLISEKTF